MGCKQLQQSQQLAMLINFLSTIKLTEASMSFLCSIDEN